MLNNIDRLIRHLETIKEIKEAMTMAEYNVMENAIIATGIDLSDYTLERTIKKLKQYQFISSGDYESADALQ